MQGAIELITFFPILLIIAVYLLPGFNTWHWALSFMIYYLSGILVRTALRKRSKLLAGLIGTAISGFLAYIIFGWNPALWLSWPIGTILVLRGVNFVERRWPEMFPVVILWAGMLLYFGSFIFFKHMEVLKPYASQVTWAGLIHVIASLFIFNSKQLKDATLTKEGEEPVLASGVVRHNRILIVIVFCVMLIIANFNRLRDGVIWLFKMIANAVVSIIVFIGSLVSSSQQQGDGHIQPGISEMFPGAESGKPGIFDYIFEILAYVLGITATAAAAIALLIFIYKGIKKLISVIKDIISRYLTDREWMAHDGGYVDVKEKLMDFKDLGRGYADKLKEWLSSLLKREPRWEELTDVREKIRYLYRHFLFRCIELGYRPKKHMTPNEIGRDIEAWNKDRGRQAEEIIYLYNLARYGNKDDELVGPQQLDELARDIRA